jgi:hypothetical protein
MKATPLPLVGTKPTAGCCGQHSVSSSQWELSCRGMVSTDSNGGSKLTLHFRYAADKKAQSLVVVIHGQLLLLMIVLLQTVLQNVAGCNDFVTFVSSVLDM